MAYNRGDIVGVATRRGVIDAAIVSVNYRRSLSLVLGPIPAPDKPVFMKGVKERHLRKPLPRLGALPHA